MLKKISEMSVGSKFRSSEKAKTVYVLMEKIQSKRTLKSVYLFQSEDKLKTNSGYWLSENKEVFAYDDEKE